MDSLRLGIPILGEGYPEIPGPGHPKWSKNALPSMAYGYNLELTPLQTLTFYNAIANNGVMVKPRFIKEVRAWNEPIFVFEKEISKEDLNEVNDSKESSNVFLVLSIG